MPPARPRLRGCAGGCAGIDGMLVREGSAAGRVKTTGGVTWGSRVGPTRAGRSEGAGGTRATLPALARLVGGGIWLLGREPSSSGWER